MTPMAFRRAIAAFAIRIAPTARSRSEGWILVRWAISAITAVELTRSSKKPVTAIYEHAARTLEVEADECVTIEDSEHGVTAAKEVNLYCIGYAHHPSQPLEHADETVQDEAELRARLDELCRTGSV